MEPASGLSTYCRGCGSHFRISKAIPTGRLTSLVAMARGKATTTPPRPAEPVKSPAMPFQISGYGEQDAPMVARADTLSRVSAPVSKEPSRVVVCFDCGASHKVSAASTSTLCPACSTYLDLRDIEVKDPTNQRIRTRGNVTVQKKGALLGSSIHCGDLTVHGTVSGSIYASGEVHLKASGKIMGEIRCQRFVVDRKCEVRCLQPVHAEEVEIHGLVTGHFHASRRIGLAKHASLTGSVTSRALSVERGGVLNGQVHVRPADPAQK